MSAVVLEHVERRIKRDCTSNFEEDVLGSTEAWLDATLLPWLAIPFAVSADCVTQVCVVKCVICI